MSAPHDGFLVKHHRPHLKWLIIIFLAILLIVSFFIGRWDQGRVSQNTEDFILDMNVSMDQLTQRNESLVKENAKLESGSKVDRDAYNAVNDNLIDLQKEILILKEELVFYRGIVSPRKTDLAVNLQEFLILPSTKNNTFKYKIILTKLGRSKYTIRGDIKLSVDGLLDGESKTITLNDQGGEKKNKLKYSFRYFQIFEGELNFPSQYYPEVVKIVIKSKTKKVKSIENTFNWAELMPGEA